MDGTYTAPDGKRAQKGGPRGTPRGPPKKGVPGGSSGGTPGGPPGGRNFPPRKRPSGGRKNPKIADFGGFSGFSGKRPFWPIFLSKSNRDLAKKGVFGEGAPGPPKLTPPGGTPRGGKKCTFSRVFNNSPSRDAKISPPTSNLFTFPFPARPDFLRPSPPGNSPARTPGPPGCRKRGKKPNTKGYYMGTPEKPPKSAQKCPLPGAEIPPPREDPPGCPPPGPRDPLFRGVPGNPYFRPFFGGDP